MNPLDHPILLDIREKVGCSLSDAKGSNLKYAMLCPLHRIIQSYVLVEGCDYPLIGARSSKNMRPGNAKFIGALPQSARLHILSGYGEDQTIKWEEGQGTKAQQTELFRVRAEQKIDTLNKCRGISRILRRKLPICCIGRHTIPRSSNAKRSLGDVSQAPGSFQLLVQ